MFIYYTWKHINVHREQTHDEHLPTSTVAYTSTHVYRTYSIEQVTQIHTWRHGDMESEAVAYTYRTAERDSQSCHIHRNILRNVLKFVLPRNCQAIRVRVSVTVV